MVHEKMLLFAMAGAVAGGVIAPRFVAAQESGSFSLLQSYVHEYTTIEHAGGNVTGGSVVGTSTVLASSGAPFVEGKTDISTCIVLAKMPEQGIDLEVSCTITDQSGDNLYIAANRRDGDLQEGGGGTGRFDILGGTGKFSGMSGQCPYQTEYLPGNFVVSITTCDWQRQ